MRRIGLSWPSGTVSSAGGVLPSLLLTITPVWAAGFIAGLMEESLTLMVLEDFNLAPGEFESGEAQ